MISKPHSNTHMSSQAPLSLPEEKAARILLLKIETDTTFQKMGDIMGCTAQGAKDHSKTGKIKDENLQKLSAAYKYRMTWLLTGEGEKYILSPVQFRIRDAMKKANNMTPFDLADATGGRLSPKTVELWLTGRADPTDAEIDIIASVLHQSPDWLKSGLAVVQENADRVIYDASGMREVIAETEAERAMLLNFRAMPPGVKKTAQTVFNALAEPSLESNDE